MKRCIIKEFETIDLIPYTIAALMMAGNIWLVFQFVNAMKPISGQ